MPQKRIMTGRTRWSVMGAGSAVVASAVWLTAQQAVPTATATSPQIDFTREIQPIFKRYLRRVPRSIQGAGTPAAAHARGHSERRPLRNAAHARQERSELAHPPRVGPRRRGSDAARQRSVAGGDDCPPAGVDRSRRADARPYEQTGVAPLSAESGERWDGGSGALVVREAFTSGSPRGRARLILIPHGLATGSTASCWLVWNASTSDPPPKRRRQRSCDG